MTRDLDLAMYVRALPVYARNLGVLFAPLIAALLAVGLSYLGAWFFAPTGGMGMGLISLIDALLYGFAFGVAIIFADDAWRHGRASLPNAWNEARRKAGNILMAVIGFYFVVFVARYIGGMLGGAIGSYALGALAVWAFIYTVPAAAIGGTPGGAALSASLQAARRHPLPTAILVVVTAIVWLALTDYAVRWLPFSEIATQIAIAVLTAIAFGYIALVVARQYSDFAFRPYW